MTSLGLFVRNAKKKNDCKPRKRKIDNYSPGPASIGSGSQFGSV
jgi:hypothetical protein